MDTPIVIFIFKRLDTVIKIIDSIKELKPKTIYLIADGPKTSEPNQQEICNKTRQAIINYIDWDCKIKKKFSDINLGGPKNIIDGISWVFETETKAIFLEDDDLASHSFILFCDELLKKYEYNEDIYIITSGKKGLDLKPNCKDSYFFDKHISSLLGFAMWRRCWVGFDKNLKGWHDIKTQLMIHKRFNSKKRYFVLKEYWDAIINNNFKSWDFTLLYNFYNYKNSIAIVPNCELVENIGIRSDGTRTNIPQYLSKKLNITSMIIPLKHPKSVDAIENSDRKIHKRKHGYIANKKRKIEKIIYFLVSIFIKSKV